MNRIIKLSSYLIIIATIVMMVSSCKMSRTRKGAIIGTGGGAVIGGVIGRASGNTALGALIGATVGGAAGAIIGRQMDKQAEEIEDALPDAKVYRVGEGIIVEFNEKILFGFDQSDLSDNAKANISKFIVVLNDYPETDIEVQGHTDNTGTEKYNMALSIRRADAVAAYMKSSGVASDIISTKGYGELAPNYENDTEEGRAQNRRVEFLITANEKMRQDAIDASAE